VTNKIIHWIRPKKDETPYMNIVAKLIMAGTKYLLTYGYGSKDFDQAKEMKDFAVYYGHENEPDENIRRHGTKLFPETSAALFGHMGLTKEHFRK